MEHVAIDLGGRESQICVRSATGDIVEERRIRSETIERYLSKRPASRVVVETCSEAFVVADAVKRSGHEIRVVPSMLVTSLGVGLRGTKTDRRDARILSEVSCRIDLPSVHIPSELARHRKSMCTMRDALVTSRTQLINSVRGWMRTVGMRVRATSQTLVDTLRLERGSQLPSYVERQLEVIEELSTQIAQADAELCAEAKADETCRRLMTVPGIGPVTAVQFVATLDTVTRFESAHRVQAYLGLAPGERSSSDRQHRTGITKAGNPAMRRLLVQAAWAARRSRRAGPMLAWTLEIEKRRGKFVATVALARKLAGIAYAVWRDGSRYDEQRSATPPQP
jgi:transposase